MVLDALLHPATFSIITMGYPAGADDELQTKKHNPKKPVLTYSKKTTHIITLFHSETSECSNGTFSLPREHFLCSQSNSYDQNKDFCVFRFQHVFFTVCTSMSQQAKVEFQAEFYLVPLMHYFTLCLSKRIFNHFDFNRFSPL